MSNLLRLVAYGIFSIILSANSAVVTVEGDNLTFTYDDSTLFGSANIVDNSIFFLPNNFSAQSVNDQGSTLSSDIVDVKIKVRDETIHLMDRFVLYESGDYKISDSTASVDVSAQFMVTSFERTCDSHGIFVCNQSEIFGATENFIDDNQLRDWSLTGFIDLDTLSLWGDDAYVNVRIQNNLYATALEQGDIAQIEKKFGVIGIQVELQPIPLPAAAWLFGSALVGLGLMRGRNA
ncbi:MAG: hypothetical protein CL691_03400 [Cellvibrionales bacterium]|nr:hypothetical protein [Cellvibrionales bacterium]|tara:strand:- start:2808 stop:3512 length:705 start_codon:yes stop_codon:yes gene_type:complete